MRLTNSFGVPGRQAEVTSATVAHGCLRRYVKTFASPGIIIRAALVFVRLRRPAYFIATAVPEPGQNRQAVCGTKRVARYNPHEAKTLPPFPVWSTRPTRTRTAAARNARPGPRRKVRPKGTRRGNT